MSESDAKIESILISVVNRLYEKESHVGLDYEDLRCFEIVTKIKKDAVSSNNNLSDDVKPETDPDKLAELIRRSRALRNDNKPIR
jgi:hypothetical protein